MKYSHAFMLVYHLNLEGYIVIANSDIFFDTSLLNTRKSCLSQIKSAYALLRFEYKNEYDNEIDKCNLYGIRGDSQDVWIFHSKFKPSKELIIASSFYLGVPGCDNKIAYLMNSDGYKCFNEPFIIKTYHYHTSKYRTYTAKDKIARPYLFIEPIIRK